ncbi:MAG: ATP synthase F1 subunit delta [Enterococcus sp.]
MKLDKYTVGKRYGKALFELAIESNQSHEIYDELMSLREIFNNIPDLGNMLSDVRLEPHEKREIMNKLTSNYDGILKNFLEVVFEYNRMGDLNFIIDEYENRYDEANGLLLGTVTTAVALSEKQLHALEENVAKKMNYKTAKLAAKVDASIIGGAIVETHNRVIDGSIRMQLDRLRNQLSR